MKQAFNPYLPSYEYTPDGEPHVFGDRVYVYGSHDRFGGHFFCQNDYVCYSASVNDLKDWRYEGVIYTRGDDPLNVKDNMCLYAPDVTKGPDGRYYLFYALDKVSNISVAVCDTPAGKYEFYGYVHYEDGTRLGEKGEEHQFDPAVITEGDTTYLYTGGVCAKGDKSVHGSMVTVIGSDMLTIKEAPKFLAPSPECAMGTDYEGHGFFEASSIRKFDGKYYFVYSSEVMHELCYATSDYPDRDFKYGGVIVSNCDIGISTYKKAEEPAAYGANNHGGLCEINGKRYIFYHRQTNNDWYARQGCAEEVKFLEDGSIPQVEITSCGLNGGPLSDTEEYPSYIVCNMYTDKERIPYVGGHHVPRVTQDGKDGEECTGYIYNIVENTTLGFKYFDFKGVKGIELDVCGYGKGDFEVRTSPEGPVLAKIGVDFETVWVTYKADCNIPDGVAPLYLKYTGFGNMGLKSFRFIH